MVYFKIFGVKIGISVSFCALMTLLVYIDRTGLVLPSFEAVVLHEAGHLIMLLVFNCKPKEVDFALGTLCIKANYDLDLKKETAVAVCGPLANILLFGGCYILYVFTAKNIFAIFSAVNLIYGGFNLLPVKGLDGETVLFNILRCFFEINICEKVVFYLGLFVCAGIFISGIFIIFKSGGNASLLLTGIYLFIGGFRRKQFGGF